MLEDLDPDYEQLKPNWYTKEFQNAFFEANIEPEGTNNNLKLLVRYDFESTEVPQPGAVNVGNLSSAAIFGASSSVFGTSIFGAVVLPSKRMIVTGSGFSNNFKFFSNDTDASYSVNGMFVSFIAGGRR